MPVLQIVLLVLIVGGLVPFILSNLSPVLPIVFLGQTTVALPLATWMGIAIAAGAFTSFFLQFLNYPIAGYSPRSRQKPGRVPPRRRSFESETREEPAEPEFQTPYTPPPPPPPPETPKSNATSDWEKGTSEDWEFDEESTIPRSGTPSPASGTTYEAPQEPKTGYQMGSTYSYSYRDTENSGVGSPDTVYDAKYRVIPTPYQKPPESEREDDDEDWGFEDDDEFFDDEDRNRRGRR